MREEPPNSRIVHDLASVKMLATYWESFPNGIPSDYSRSTSESK
jgi:hypothetical protein